MQIATVVIIWLLWLGVLTALVLLMLRTMYVRRRASARIFADDGDPPEPLPREDEQGWLARWLYKAGFRGDRAVSTFLGLTALGTVFGVVVLLLFYSSGTVAKASRLVRRVPGGVGDLFLPIIEGAPWMALVLGAGAPALVVRAARRRRVQEVEQDLPIVLELLATLAEVGSGFDAAVERVLESLPPQRALSQELRAFQRDNLAGRGRVESLRWLDRRVAVTWFSIFVSAVVQAEQIGAGLADVLKIQAEDLRQRRREQALGLAMATPVKLILPLIVCYMPGIFTAALGPTFFELIKFLDSFVITMRPR